MALPSSLVARAYVIGGAMIFVVALATGAWRFVALGTAPDEGPLVAGLLINTLLFGVFALHHSVLAREPVKARVSRAGVPSIGASNLRLGGKPPVHRRLPRLAAHRRHRLPHAAAVGLGGRARCSSPAAS